MRTPTSWIHGLAALLLATACGSSTSGGNGTMSVHLVDAPGDYQRVNLRVERVEIHGDTAGWVTLGTPARTVDLLALQGGVSEALASGATLPAGSYGQLRLILGAGNTVTLADGSVHDLKVPSGAQSGVKLNVHFDVAPGTTKDVFVDFDAHRSIFVHRAGNSGKYLLRPVVRAFDAVVTGSVAGKLSDAQTHAGLPGVVVTAQTLDAAGNPTIARATTTRADGTYLLDLLPVGGSYFVVSQPVVGGSSYAARASAPIAITATAPTAVYVAELTVTSQVGTLAGTIAPTATEADGDVVEVIQSLVDGASAPHRFVVRAEPATVADLLEGYAILGVPAGNATVLVTRSTLDLDGNELVRSSAAAAVLVPPGGTVTTDLVVP